MREEIARFVFPILSYGTQLKERLATQEENLEFETEQRKLKGMLQEATPAALRGDMGDLAGAESRTRDGFLGIRYALACWLDEIFIGDSPWRAQWNENKLEQELYGTNDRAWNFWEQARQAASRTGTDALEVYFLCTMLGFRGEKVDNPEELKNWREGVEAQLARGQEAEWQSPLELQPQTNVPPLQGSRRMKKMITTGIVAMLVLIPLAVLGAVTFFLQP